MARQGRRSSRGSNARSGSGRSPAAEDETGKPRPPGGMAGGGVRSIRRVVCLSDLHVGSTRAILPPGFITIEGHGVRLSAPQEWLWEAWEATGEWIARKVRAEPFALVVNGDLIEGIHHRSTQVWSPDSSDHVAAAIRLLEPMAEAAARIYIVRGTEAHSGSAAEIVIGTALGAQVVHGQHAADCLDLAVHGCHCRFVHHIGTSSRLGLYATQLGVMLAEAQAQAARFGQEVPRVYVAGHRHTYGAYRDDRGLCITLPAWQVLTRYGWKVAPASVVGAGAVILDWSNAERGELPEVHSFIYRPGRMPATEI